MIIMKLKVHVQKIMEVETSNPIFEELLAIHRNGDVGTAEQYSTACVVIEGITGYPAFEAETEFDETVVGVYTEDESEAILEM